MSTCKICKKEFERSNKKEFVYLSLTSVERTSKDDGGKMIPIVQGVICDNCTGIIKLMIQPEVEKPFVPPEAK